jgi:hypothetical protein
MGKARAEEGEFRGYPTITFFTGREYNGKEVQITMGLDKAQAVDDCIDDLRMFIDKHGRKSDG